MKRFSMEAVSALGREPNCMGNQLSIFLTTHPPPLPTLFGKFGHARAQFTRNLTFLSLLRRLGTSDRCSKPFRPVGKWRVSKDLKMYTGDLPRPSYFFTITRIENDVQL